MNTPDTAVSVLRDEYQALKAEQLARISLRDGLVYAMIVAVAAVTGGTTLAGRAVPLLLPPVGIVLGWTHLTNDRAVTAIARYLRDDLAPRLHTATGAPALRWEHLHVDRPGRRRHKTGQLVVDLTVFVLPGLLASCTPWWTGHPAPGLLAASVIESVAVLAFAAEVVHIAVAATGLAGTVTS